MINTRFWNDSYISDLDPVEKLLFLYFLTNPATEICGIYELPLKNVAFDTGIEKNMVENILEKFTKDNKIFYINGWVGIKNFVKHQLDNPKVHVGIKNGLERAPEEIKSRVQIGYLALSHSDLDSDSDLNLDSDLDLTVQKTPKDECIEFFSMVEEAGLSFTEFITTFSTKTNIPVEVISRELKKFSAYWTEKNSTGKKQRWQTEKTFEVKRRLSTWLQKAGQWSKTATNKYQAGIA